MPSDPSKDALRQGAIRRREGLTAADWSRADAARTAVLLRALGDRQALAAYASRPGEPDTAGAIEHWRLAGIRVLLPALGSSPAWAWHVGPEALRPGWAGIPEPTGARLGPEAISLVDVVVVPCLLVDRSGTRLGTGGGWYDRVLPSRRPGAEVWALARAEEVVERLPRQPHDVPVDAVVTERGILRLG